MEQASREWRKGRRRDYERYVVTARVVDFSSRSTRSGGEIVYLMGPLAVLRRQGAHRGDVDSRIRGRSGGRDVLRILEVIGGTQGVAGGVVPDIRSLWDDCGCEPVWNGDAE